MKTLKAHFQALLTQNQKNVTYDNLSNVYESKALNPDMPTQELLLHMGELTQSEILTARAAIRWANSEFIHENNTSQYTLGGQNHIPDNRKMVMVEKLCNQENFVNTNEDTLIRKNDVIKMLNKRILNFPLRDGHGFIISASEQITIGGVAKLFNNALYNAIKEIREM